MHHVQVNVFLIIALALVVGGAGVSVTVWALERSHRVEEGQGDKIAMIGAASAIAGLPLLVIALIYVFA